MAQTEQVKDVMAAAALCVLLESEPVRKAFDELTRCRDACSDYGYRTGRIGDHQMARLNEDFQRAAVRFVDALREVRRAGVTTEETAAGRKRAPNCPECNAAPLTLHAPGCEGDMRQQRDELSEEMERCHRLLDGYWGLSLETTALDTLEDRLEMLLAEIARLPPHPRGGDDGD